MRPTEIVERERTVDTDVLAIPNYHLHFHAIAACRRLSGGPHCAWAIWRRPSIPLFPLGELTDDDRTYLEATHQLMIKHGLVHGHKKKLWRILGPGGPPVLDNELPYFNIRRAAKTGDFSTLPPSNTPGLILELYLLRRLIDVGVDAFDLKKEIDNYYDDEEWPLAELEAMKRAKVDEINERLQQGARNYIQALCSPWKTFF